MKTATIALLIAVFSVSAIGADAPKPAPDKKAFGLELGENLILPQCGEHEYVSAKRTCYQAPYGNEPSVLNPDCGVDCAASLVFADDGRPQLGVAFTVIVDQGKLVGLRIVTMGVRDQDEVIEVLLKKYGSPTTRSDFQVKNLEGAEFKAVSATWKFSDLVVQYDSVDPDLTEGLLTIETPDRYSRRTKKKPETAL